ncbi:MAG: hypothetical protein R3B13_36485 [Polyangiaceae bacterium]
MTSSTWCALAWPLLLGACSLSNSLDDLKGPTSGVGGAAGSSGAGGGAAAGGLPSISATPPFRRIAAGGDHVCVRDSTDRVFCWGSNSSGQLGAQASGTSVTKPTRVEGVTNVDQIACGNFHSCAFGPSGNWCWGKGEAGELGDGKGESSATPRQVDLGGAKVKSAAAGGGHTCVVMGDGSAVWCWGNNTAFQTSSSASPDGVLTPTDTGLTSQFALAAGASHSCAARTTDVAQCWGDNSDGQLGDGTFADHITPTDTVLPSEVSQLASRSRHTCAIVKGGDLYCWGLNDSGQIGIGTTSANEATPEQVLRNTAALKPIRVTAGSDHTCAIEAGKAYCWGGNAKGQLGTGTTAAETSPAAVALPAGTVVFDIAAGSAFTCALTLQQGASEADTIQCWGSNTFGQVGQSPSADPHPTPVAIGL